MAMAVICMLTQSRASKGSLDSPVMTRRIDALAGGVGGVSAIPRNVRETRHSSKTTSFLRQGDSDVIFRFVSCGRDCFPLPSRWMVPYREQQGEKTVA